MEAGLIDFGYRAVHETSVQSKAIIRAFYDGPRNPRTQERIFVGQPVEYATTGWGESEPRT